MEDFNLESLVFFVSPPVSSLHGIHETDVLQVQQHHTNVNVAFTIASDILRPFELQPYQDHPKSLQRCHSRQMLQDLSIMQILGGRPCFVIR